MSYGPSKEPGELVLSPKLSLVNMVITLVTTVMFLLVAVLLYGIDIKSEVILFLPVLSYPGVAIFTFNGIAASLPFLWGVHTGHRYLRVTVLRARDGATVPSHTVSTEPEGVTLEMPEECTKL